jgi:hypothetical protein
MRFDLIPERDRFIPGWHSRPDPLRAEFTRPEWQWPWWLYRAARVFLSRLLQACRAATSLPGPAIQRGRPNRALRAK